MVPIFAAILSPESNQCPSEIRKKSNVAAHNEYLTSCFTMTITLRAPVEHVGIYIDYTHHSEEHFTRELFQLVSFPCF